MADEQIGNWPGLSVSEAAARLQAEGFNELPQPDRRTLPRIAFEVVREPMFALLLAGGILYLVLGNLQEALMLLAFASISVTITIVQEHRGERVLDALRELSSPRALVIRDGKPTRIAGRDVVRGDVIVLAEGDRVPADATLLEARDIQIDESLLTGEPVPVRKAVRSLDGSSQRPGGDDLPLLFSGTLVVRGHGTAIVTSTGGKTELGRIGGSLAAIKPEPTRLSQQTGTLVRVAAFVGGGISVTAVVLYGITRGAWLDGLLGGVAISMSMLPEEFPLVLTVFMVMGAWRISRARVLTRRAAAIEMLGAATVLCTDKTGTLTQNRMVVAELWADGIAFSPGVTDAMAGPIRDLARTAVLACAEQPFDPMEIAIRAIGRELSEDRARPRDGGKFVHGYGLRPELLAMTQVWRTGEASGFVVATKGAPEAVAELCHLDPSAVSMMRTVMDEMAGRGMRVLAVGRGEFSGDVLPASQRDFALRFLGLIGFSDPLRPAVPDAVGECRRAGIRVIMITGDYPATARAIATQAGLDEGNLVAGHQLSEFTDDALRDRVASTTIFARTMPEQKLRIVEALKATGEVVAMTGDGVNDAPSLKAAHIGVAMGGRGTDVAREAASIVLLDDDFASLVHTVRLGRRIYDNIRKAFGYIVAVHVPIAGLALLPFALGWPVLLGPIHIAFIEMVIDPVCSIVFEAEREEDDTMRRPPRDPAQPLFSRALAGWGIVQGVLAFLVLASAMIIARMRAMPDDEVRALVFVTLVTTNIGLILVNRTYSASIFSAFKGNAALLWAVVGVAFSLLLLSVTWPPAERLFHFGPLHGDDLAITLVGGLIVLVLLDWMKPVFQARLRT
jgi:Ca2+-transporting ATPase